MPYKVTIDENEALVTVCMSGQVTHKEHVATQAEAVRLCKEKKCSKILADLKNLDTAQSSVMDCYDFGISLSKAMAYYWLANVLPTDPQSKQNVKFVLTVAGNRGGSVREFDDVEAARKWLSNPDK
jgi:hypothetical protein